MSHSADSPAVKSVVVGAHRAPGGRGPGLVTRGVATRLRQPLLVIPPGATVPTTLARVLLPLEGTPATTAPIRAVLEELALDPETRLVAVHCYAYENAPRFADHEPHDSREQFRAFTPHLPDRYAGGIVFRLGPPERAVPEEAAELGASLTVVTWSQVFAPGRAMLVTKLLSDLAHPTLLVPAQYGSSRRVIDLGREDDAGSVRRSVSAR